MCAYLSRVSIFLMAGVFVAGAVWAGADPGHPTYVNLNNTSGNEDGLGWDTAFARLQPGLDAAAQTGGGEVWVAKGTYSEIRDNTGALGSLVLWSGVDVFGGFAGTEVSIEERDASANLTIIDGSASRVSGKTLAPAYHVVRGDNVNDAVLDGFLIMGGVAMYPSVSETSGGGIYLSGADATVVLAHLTLHGNNANTGGGISLKNASPVIRNCRIVGNGGMDGGGLYLEGSSPQIDNVLMLNNVAAPVFELEGRGGAAYMDGESSPFMANITVAGSLARDAALYSAPRENTGPLLVNAAISYTGDMVHDVAEDVAGDIEATFTLAQQTLPGNGNQAGRALFRISEYSIFTDDALYDGNTRRTAFFDTSKHFAPGSLAGALLRTDLPEAPWFCANTFVILENTETSFTVFGNVPSYGAAGTHYALLDGGMEKISPAVDAGTSVDVPSEDYLAQARGYDGDGLGAITGDGSDFDLGFLEYTGQPRGVVPFMDAKLETAVLGVLPGAAPPIPTDEFVVVTSLDASSRNITNLWGLEYGVNLETLNLSGNAISRLGALSDLNKLSWLDLHQNQITELSALLANGGLGGNDFLDLRGNPLTEQAVCVDLPVLLARFTTPDHVLYDQWCGPQARLILAVTGVGTVNPAPGITVYHPGDHVALSATPIPGSGYAFDRWEGDVSSEDSLVDLVMDTDKSVTAKFVSSGAETHTLTLQRAGDGQGDLVPGEGVFTYMAGRSVAIGAAPYSGDVFAGWSGDFVSTHAAETIVMDADKVVTATFLHNYAALDIAITGTGSTTPEPGTYYYVPGTQATLTASDTDPMWHFDHWEGAVDNPTSPQTTITLTQSEAVTAVFVHYERVLDIRAYGHGTTLPAPGLHGYHQGETVQIQAIPEEGFVLSGWMGDLEGQENPASVTMDTDRTVFAFFALPDSALHHHSADVNHDWKISLDELLEVIRFFNSAEYHCDPASGSGYESGPGNHDCVPHDSDYNPQDWIINLDELLRLISYFDAGGYYVSPASPDGFAPLGVDQPHLQIHREILSPSCLPGQTFDIRVTVDWSARPIPPMSAIQVREMIPAGWTFVESSGPPAGYVLQTPAPGEPGDIVLKWFAPSGLEVPNLPVELTYRIQAPADQIGVPHLNGDSAHVLNDFNVIAQNTGAFASAVRVDQRNTSGIENGRCWETAFTKIQPAIDLAAAEGGGDVWVAKGTYREIRDNTAAPGSLVLRNGVNLFGGFSGVETQLEERDTNKNLTVIDGHASLRSGSTTVPASHVVYGCQVHNVTLDGFLITGGSGRNDTSAGGGGIYLSGVRDMVLLKNLTIHRNDSYYGGGIYLEQSYPVLHNCRIINNKGLTSGGGIFASSWNPTVENVLLLGNVGGNAGAVNYVPDQSHSSTNITIADNWSSSSAIVCSTSTSGYATLVNAVMDRNHTSAPNMDPNVSGNIAVSYSLVSRDITGDGNRTGHALFRLSHHSVFTAAPSYNAGAYRTTFFDDTQAFTPGALSGMIVRTYDRQPTEHGNYFVILDNTETSFAVYGNQTGYGWAGDWYCFLDGSLEPDSPAVDTGTSANTPTLDYLGQARGYDGDGLGRVTGDNSDYDMGFLEYTGQPWGVAFFPDRELETAVLSALPGFEHTNDLLPLTTLNASSRGIADVSGLEYCVNLETLDLGGNIIHDIEALSALTSLSHLDLHGNQLTNIDVLLANPGIGGDDVVDLRGNPLTEDAVCNGIPALQARFNNPDNVIFDQWCGPQARLTIRLVGVGMVTPHAGITVFHPGDEVYISAALISGSGYAFKDWQGSVYSSNTVLGTIVMNTDVTLTATFVNSGYALYTLSLARAGDGEGTILPGEGVYMYISGREVHISATPQNGSGFGGWSGSFSSMRFEETVVMYENKTLTATFMQGGLPLTMNIAGLGMTEPPPGTYYYAPNAVVPLNAYETDSLWFFDHWGGNIGEIYPDYTIIMTEASTVTAVFLPYERVLEIKTLGNGTTSPSPGLHGYHPGAQVSLWATANAGASFFGWMGDLYRRENPVSLTMDANHVVIASFQGGNSIFHTADQNHDWQIDMHELSRIIQFFNSGGFHCAAGTEDGYAPGPGNTDCAPHDSDFSPRDWLINLPELLRMMQFFNSNGYHVDVRTEDGFAPGVEPPPRVFTVTRTVTPPAYVPGETVEVHLIVTAGEKTLSAMSAFQFQEMIPSGWSYTGAISSPAGFFSNMPSPGNTGTLRFGWFSLDSPTVPPMPIELTYQLQVPMDQQDRVYLSGSFVFVFSTDYPYLQDIATTFIDRVPNEGEGGVEGEGNVEGEGGIEGEGIIEGEGNVEGEGVTEGEGIIEGEGEIPAIHSADSDGNGVISLSELLRVIQLFNAGAYHCLLGTEDGYEPYSGDTSCTPHSADYNPRDWRIDVSELLRIVQFYNSGGYHACPDSEDGFCPGTGEIEGFGEGEGEIEGSEGMPSEGAQAEGEGVTEGEGEVMFHTADQNGDGLISLPELLRVVQLFNSNGFHCAAGSEDGYAAGPGDTNCASHSSDYAPQDWSISLPELLRTTQFFNSGGYHYCPGEGTEDGYCAGRP